MIPLRLYGYVGVAATFLAVLGFAGCEHNNANKARAERDKIKIVNSLLAEANVANVDTIEALKRANALWQKTCKREEEYTQLLDEKKAADERITNLLKQNVALRNKDRELPQCVALLKISLSQRCPNIAAGVLKLAGSQDSASGSTGTGSEADSR